MKFSDVLLLLPLLSLQQGQFEYFSNNPNQYSNNFKTLNINFIT